jgi:hypothetical protein
MQLSAVYGTYGEKLERDLFFYYGVDINECSLRRLRVLYEGLPYDSLTNQEIGDMPDEARLWDVNTYMQANILDQLAWIQWSIAASNSKHPPRKPKPIARPKLTNKRPEKKARWVGKTVYVPPKS